VVMAKAASAEDEAEWLSAALGRTVRAMRELVKERAAGAEDREGAGQMSAMAERRDGTGQMSAVDAIGDEGRVTLTLTVDREDAWLFEAARMTVKRAGGSTREDAVEALLGEATTSLLAGMEWTELVPFDEAMDGDRAQRAWELELARYREEAEARCESRFNPRSDVKSDAGAVDWDAGAVDWDADAVDWDADAVDWDGGAEEIDAALRGVAAELARRDLLLGEIAERFWSADGWRRLGYGTAAQYARERLGMSLSSVKAKRALARRARSMPRLREAVNGRELGFEAARLVAGVASSETARVPGASRASGHAGV